MSLITPEAHGCPRRPLGGIGQIPRRTRPVIFDLSMKPFRRWRDQTTSAFRWGPKMKRAIVICLGLLALASPAAADFAGCDRRGHPGQGHRRRVHGLCDAAIGHQDRRRRHRHPQLSEVLPARDDQRRRHRHRRHRARAASILPSSRRRRPTAIPARRMRPQRTPAGSRPRCCASVDVSNKVPCQSRSSRFTALRRWWRPKAAAH